MHSKFLLLSLAVAGLAASVLGGPLPFQPSLKARPMASLAGEHTADGAGGSERRKRSFGALHNYVDIVYEKSDYTGEWMLNNCSSEFNCNTVSPHHCNHNVSRTFECSDNQVRSKCTIQFDAYQNDYLDLDLALYKASERDHSSSYKIYILFMHTPRSGHLVVDTTISSACSGWQIFHLDPNVREWLKTSSDPKLSFRIIVKRNATKTLSCEQVSDLFLLSASTSQEYEEQGLVEEDEGERGEEGSGEESSLPTEPPSKDTNPFPIPRDQQIDYIPILTLFRWTPKSSSVFGPSGLFGFQRRKRDKTGAIS